MTSSLDSLLNIASPAKLPESSHIPAKEIDANIDTQAPESDQSPQKTTASEHVQIKSHAIGHQPIPLPYYPHQVQQFKDDSTDTTDATDHSEAKNEKSLTDSPTQVFVSNDTNVQAKSTSCMVDQTLTLPGSFHQERSTDDLTVVIPPSIVPTAASSKTNEPHQVMLCCNDKLITALSLDPQRIAETMLAKGLIPENTEAQMRQCSTPREKATILVSTVRHRVEIAPKRFDEFVKILAGHEWTKDILDVLQSCISPVKSRKDTGVQAVSTDDRGSTNKEHKSSSDTSSNGDEYTFPELNSQDKAELEAQLILSADRMRKKFASLLLSVVTSFKRQGIDPRELATGILALTEHADPAVGKPLLERDKDALMRAQLVDHSFDVLRPHMTFFNYEILEFLIEEMGSPNDKLKLQTFLQEFRRFCRRSVFEIPPSVLGHSAEKAIDQQRFCVKITKQFKAALLVQCAKQREHDSQSTSSSQLSPGQEDREGICAPELGISLEDAKEIQRKLASVLKLKVSSIYLDSASSGSIILTFLLPSHISLAGLDSDPDIIALSSNGIHILCGPPGKPKQKELTSDGLILQWSQPEYGCPSLAKYILHQKKCGENQSPSEWQKLELSSLETHTCVPDVSDGDMYIFKICTVSDAGTLQFGDGSDPIVISADGILTNNIHKVIAAHKDGLISAFSSADPNTVAAMLSKKGVISSEDGAQISLASTPSEKGKLLVAAIEREVMNEPQKFQHFLNAVSEAELSLPGDVMEVLWSDYYDSVCERYLGYLKFLYASLDKKRASSDQWPPSATKKFFRLAMIKSAEVKRGHIYDWFIQMTITGKVDDILQEKYPIQLEDIFKESERQRQVTKENEGQRKVILLEGAPGCGKSTLSVYICQQWEKGQLFNQFKLVILVRLRDPAVKSAKGLADLLPCPDTTTAQEIAARMLANKCQDILFVLDGWDELPPSLRKHSIFHQLVQPNVSHSNPLCESTVIVTSRPIASGDLHQLVSSRVEILGFTAEELHQFFAECLKGDTEAVKTLLERIEENPEVAGSCYLPLNATILVHLFKSDCNTLPTTLYGIFSSLILNCIKRHLKLRVQYKDVSIESLDQLPEFAKEPFSVLCRLAYDGVMEDKVVFTSLPADVNALSLLQGMESFVGRTKTASYNFIHLSIQELLAAWYISTQIPASDQVSKFNKLFNNSRFSAVFRFYAAITKLKTPGIKGVVISVTKEYKSGVVENKVLMVSLLQCLYEAQNSALCDSVAQQLQHRLYLQDTTLTPSDCLCIGYFLAHVCSMPLAAVEFKVGLGKSGIGDQGCKYLVTGLQKHLDTHSAVSTLSLLYLHVGANGISHHGLRHLSTLLKIGCICELNLHANNLVSNKDPGSNSTFSIFAEQLKNNTTLIKLRLSKCGLNSRSAESFAEGLATNQHLKQLIIEDNPLCDDGVQHLAHALKVNQGLKELDLGNCGMTDVGVECLFRSLQYNKGLNKLAFDSSSIHHSNLLTEKIIPLIAECLHSNHTLIQLQLPKNLKSFGTSIEKAVNDVRKLNGLPIISVAGVCLQI